jgi:hypothetical protein
VTNPLERIPGGARRWLAALALAVPIAVVPGARGVSAEAAPAAASDPWSAAQLIRPAELAGLLAKPDSGKPLLLHVGFKVLYRAGAIPGTRYVGPGSRRDGIVALERAVKGVPRDRSIVLYCGCCPWDHCPNMRPAFRALRKAGFTNLRALYIPKDLDTDWVKPGYPIVTPKE